MLLSDDAATLECKYAAQQWLQSEDPLIRDFGARLQSILAFQQQRRKNTLIINHLSLFIMNQHVCTYIYIYICTCIQVVKGRYTRYLRIILCGALWVPVPETFRIYSLFLPATLCLVHREYNGKTLHLSKIACSIALPATSLPTGLLCSKTMNLRKQGSCIPPKDLLPEEFLEYPWGPGILRGNFEHT